MESSTNNIATEKINFTENHEIERTLPMLLADNGKMPLQIWNKFCDDIDEKMKPLKRIACISYTLWSIVGIMCILLAFGWTFVSNISKFYPIIAPVTVIVLIAVCHVHSHISKKVASRISRICASASNRDKDLTMTLKGIESDSWFIEVALRNAIDVENAVSATAVVAESESIPVAAAATPVVANAVSSGPAPKKYVKGEDGKMTLNPEYTEWKNSK